MGKNDFSMKDFKYYPHTVEYYETDAMRVVHHSNYLRWMESARCSLLEDLGMPFASLEERNITSPVTELSISYKRAASFGQKVQIGLRLEEYNGIRYSFSYRIMREEVLLAEAKSTHCFVALDKPKVLSLARTASDYHERFITKIKELSDEKMDE